MNHNWYAVITAEVLMNKELTDKQKLLVALISNLSNEKGYAFASNKYLSECLCCSEVTIRQNISSLEEKGYIGRVIKLNDRNEIEYRSLTVIDGKYPPIKNNHTPDEIQSPPPDEIQSHKNKLKNNKGKKEITVASLNVQQSGEVYKSVKEFYIGLYKEEFNTEPYFQPRDGAKIYDLIRKVYFKMKEKDGREIFSVEEVSHATNFFLQATLSTADNWLGSNFNLSNIDSKFNDIYSKIINGKSGNTKNSRPTSRFRKAN